MAGSTIVPAGRSVGEGARLACKRPRRRRRGGVPQCGCPAGGRWRDVWLAAGLTLVLSGPWVPMEPASADIPAGETGIQRGSDLSGSVGPAAREAARRYVLDDGGAVGVRVRFEPEGGGGVCGVRVRGGSPGGAVRLDHASSSHSDYSARVHVPVGPVRVEIYSTGPTCRFRLQVD